MTRLSSKSTRRKESFLSIWLRRCITVPLYFLLAAVCLCALPIWLLFAGLADIVTGRFRKFPLTRALLFFALYLFLEIAGVLMAFFIWFFLAGGLIGGADRFIEANAALQRWWSGALFGGSLIIFSMHLKVEGQEQVRRGPMILFVRHSSTADTVLAAVLVANPFHLLLRYVIKRELLWDPCLDIVGRRLPNTFVDRRSKRVDAEAAAVAELSVNLNERSAALIFPEGTRFTPDRLRSAVTLLRRKKIDDLAGIAQDYRNVLPPKLIGPFALLDAAPGVDLLIVEHTGFESAESFAEFFGGGLIGETIHVRLRRTLAF